MHQHSHTEQAEKQTFFSPGSLLAIFNAHLSVKEEKKIIAVRGIFRKTGTANYGGFFYDRLKDEASENSISLVVSSLMHNQLDDNKTIEFNGYITRRLDKFGKIELIINLIELVAQRANTFSEEEIKKVDLLNKKIALGFRDLDAHIKTAIFDNRPIVIKVILGKSGIINSDITKALESAVAHYDLEFHRVSLNSIDELVSKLRMLDLLGADLICVSRGGGDNLEVFENLDLCQTILEMQTIVGSAIGHADNVTLFEKLADKKFITPTQFGHYLRDIHNTTVEDLQRSKAKIIQDAKQEVTVLFNQQIENLKLNHQQQLQTLNQKLQSFEALSSKSTKDRDSLHAKEVDGLRRQMDDIVFAHKRDKDSLYRQLREARSRSGTSVIAIIIAILIGIVIGSLIASKR